MSIFIGSSCYSFWIICFILPSYYAKYKQEHGSMEGAPAILNKNLIEALLFITAAVNGAGAGILWVSVGKFISECACQENSGFFNSYFWCFFMASQIIGNVTAGVVLE